MTSIKIQHKTPREVLGPFLAVKVNYLNDWPQYYNEDQKEFWFKKADEVLAFIKKNNLI